jgi:hypothetical protein
MSFGSASHLLGAVLLAAAAIAAWAMVAALKPAARLNLRFAAMLFAAIAVAAPFGRVGDVAMLIVLPPASAALALASLARFARGVPPLPASLALAAALVCGLAAALLGAPMPAAVPVAVAACLVAGAALQDFAWIAALSGLALLACLFAFLREGTGSGALLFAAVTLLGLARSTFAVEQTRDAGRGVTIGAIR